jgi:hypothetical protein
MGFPSPQNWEPGIYFGLDEDTYHALPWCGSGDIKMLAYNPQDYWASSPMNPLRDEIEDKTTPARVFGSAIHAAILYGDAVYKRRYGYVENDTNKTDVSAEGLKAWIKAQGAEPRKLKEDNIRYIADTWGVTLIPERQNEQILKAAATMRSNPYLVPAFQNGWPEVSIFWIEEDVPCKARIDYLKIKATVDLKSFRSKDRLMELDRMVLADIFKYRYDAQAKHYTDGRLAAAELLAAGKVFAPDPDPRDPKTLTRPSDEWLEKCFAQKEPGWVFIFYKADGMPIAKPYQSAFNGPMMASGGVIKRRALTNYQTFMERFGTGPWVNTDEPYQIDEEDIPKWA